ncbi:hypothetical protein EU803_01140 [Loktanella sp. IMCC34160]|uniref:PKD domain-containing protein n=1 Tax=Loktanella sp. IMCC34160 TaxID=2510646 RepID=UPI00101CCA61|nr:Ig-like domain-containing protein [Loktanella sp. IMCC34160]RYG92741.1 hypothetical protein EU803_01140 [Loktanella sp. IMCC34160]
MLGKFGQFAVLGAALVGGFVAQEAQAFGGGTPVTMTNYGDVPGTGVDDDCPNSWLVYYDGSSVDAEILLAPATGLQGSWVDGERYFINSYSSGLPAITAAAIDATCSSLSNVTMITSNGIEPANESVAGFPAEDYYGIVFEADHTNGNRYRYELAISGQSGTTVINTRTQLASNTVPTADAGGNQSVAPGALVTLDGSASDANDVGQSLTYAWSQTGGTNSVSLSSTTVVQPTFTAPVIGSGDPDDTLIFTLVVNDGADDSLGDSVLITVQKSLNAGPTASAGSDQSVASGAGVTLNASGSTDVEPGQTLTYAWVEQSSEGISLTGAATAAPTFTAPTLNIGDPSKILTFQVTVTDPYGLTSTDTVQVTVNAPGNTPPTANAGSDQNVASGASVTLDGTASDPNDTGQTLTYAWSQTGGTSVSLSSTTAAQPTFTAPTLAIGAVDDVLTFQLIVNDGFAPSVADVVQVTVTAPANTAPTADAGTDQLVASGANVTLDGTASDPNDAGQTLSYLWSQTGGTTVTLSSTTAAQPTFTAPTLVIGDADAVLTFQLIVNDGIAPSVADTVTITVDAPNNTVPTANAGTDQLVLPNATVTLDGTGSNANDAGQTLTYTWSQTSGTTVTLSSTTAAQPTFTAPNLVIGDADAVLVFQLIVNDGFDNSLADTVQITVDAPTNTAPTANAGPDQSVPAGSVVTLDGTASAANDVGQSLTYGWSQASGTTVTLSSTTAAQPTFTAPSLNIGDADVVMTFDLIVNDGFDNSVADTVQITALAPLDTEAPVITPPANLAGEAGPGGTRSFAFSATVTDNHDLVVTPVFTLAGQVITSPHDFPVGVNTVLINAQDVAGNPAAEQSFTVTVTAAVAPATPVITSTNVNGDQSITVQGTAEADSTVRVTFPGGTFVELTATGGVFSATSAANMQSGTVSVTAADELGNTSGTATVAVIVDTTPPGVTVSGVPATFTGTTPFDVTIAFDEEVVGFDIGDITVVNGTATNLTGGPVSFGATITPSGTGDVSVSVAAAVATDLAGNDNIASSVETSSNSTPSETEALLLADAETRGRQLIGAQPNLNGFLSGRNGGFQAQATRGVGTFSLTTDTSHPVWVYLQGAWSTSGTAESQYLHGAFGGHIINRDDLVMGAMVQLDQSGSEDGVASIDTRGWMAGPYMVVRAANQPLVFSGSYLIGQADVSISPLGTYTDTVTTDRTLLTLGIAGEFDAGRMTIMPSLDLAHLTEDQPAYIDGALNPISAQSLALTEAAAGLHFSLPIAVASGDMTMTGGISAILSRSDLDGTISESSRGRVDIGFVHASDNGVRTSLRAYLDGLGDDAYESVGAEFLVQFEF